MEGRGRKGKERKGPKTKRKNATTLLQRLTWCISKRDHIKAPYFLNFKFNKRDYKRN